METCTHFLNLFTRPQYQPIIILRPHRLLKAFNYCTQQLYTVSLLMTMHKHYFKQSQDHNCRLSAVCTIQHTSSECFIMRFKRRECSSSVLYQIKSLFSKFRPREITRQRNIPLHAQNSASWKTALIFRTRPY